MSWCCRTFKRTDWQKTNVSVNENVNHGNVVKALAAPGSSGGVRYNNSAEKAAIHDDFQQNLTICHIQTLNITFHFNTGLVLPGVDWNSGDMSFKVKYCFLINIYFISMIAVNLYLEHDLNINSVLKWFTKYTFFEHILNVNNSFEQPAVKTLHTRVTHSFSHQIQFAQL